MIRWCLTLIVLIAATESELRAQKIVATVKVFREKLQGRNLDLFEGFEQRLTQYIHDYDWSKTGDPTPLPVDIQIVIERASDEGEFRFVTATLYVTNGKELQFLDENAKFVLRKGGTFYHDLTTIDPFLSIIDFYMFLILGDEMDTLGRFLGTSFFQSARSLATQAKAVHGSWDARVELATEFLDTRYQDYRLMKDHFYEGMSLFEEGDVAGARTSAKNAVDLMEKMLTQVLTKNHTERFLQVHHLDLCKVFSGGRDLKVFDRLVQMDPKNKDTYLRYKQNQQ